ncbi:hypothetical protein, partial [Burkholderia ubonensis]|uniref:hypothetical protein n=1 Tax=Burkholderia ubonensis TaxID=101571 RepID=UPI0039F56EFF
MIRSIRLLSSSVAWPNVTSSTCLPRMLRRAALVAAVRQLHAPEPVMLDVVHDFEQRRAVHRPEQ